MSNEVGIICTAIATLVVVWTVLTLFYAWDEFENIGNWLYYNSWGLAYWEDLENPYSYASKHTSEKHKAQCLKKLDALREEDRKFFKGWEIADKERQQRTGGKQ